MHNHKPQACLVVSSIDAIWDECWSPVSMFLMRRTTRVRKFSVSNRFFDNWSEQDWILCVSLFFGAVRNHPFMWVSRLQSLWSFPPMRCGPASLEPSTPELAPHTSHVISHHLTTRQWPEQNCQSCEHNDTQMNWLQWLIIIHSGVHMRNSIYPSIYPCIHPSIHM